MRSSEDAEAERQWWLHKMANEKVDEAGLTGLEERQAFYDLLVDRPLHRWQRQVIAGLILTNRENRENSGGSDRS